MTAYCECGRLANSVSRRGALRTCCSYCARSDADLDNRPHTSFCQRRERQRQHDITMASTISREYHISVKNTVTGNIEAIYAERASGPGSAVVQIAQKMSVGFPVRRIGP